MTSLIQEALDGTAVHVIQGVLTAAGALGVFALVVLFALWLVGRA
jgi:hypothetical protein